MKRCEITGSQHPYVHRHHIKTRGSGGTNDPDNLIDICPFHHVEIHQGYLILDRCGGTRHEAQNVIEGADAVREYLRTFRQIVQAEIEVRLKRNAL